jgi:hypothetical protein
MQQQGMQDTDSQKESFLDVETEYPSYLLALQVASSSAQIARHSLQSGALRSQLPPESDPSGSTLEGLRVLQCIEWLNDRIMDGSIGHDDSEMVILCPSPTRDSKQIQY